MDVQNIDQVAPYTTKDGSEIRELLWAGNSCIRRQSLAEARLQPGFTTTLHHHVRTEEIYYILSGCGQMEVDGQVREVAPGDAIAIPPGARHRITALGSSDLRLLCCCSPGYSHDDTVLAGEVT